jgi:branched-chain amino acid transport system ATP-binding protein/sulfate-transporting ATPase
MSQQALNTKPKLLEAQNLTMRFGGVTALDSLNLHVNEGEVLGLLGPNGSGKTTFLMSLLVYIAQAQVKYISVERA